MQIAFIYFITVAVGGYPRAFNVKVSERTSIVMIIVGALTMFAALIFGFKGHLSNLNAGLMFTAGFYLSGSFATIPSFAKKHKLFINILAVLIGIIAIALSVVLIGRLTT